MASEGEITIPERHVEFCREVARLCEKYELMQFRGSFDPKVFDEWRDRIEFSWDWGRHGDQAREVRVTSTKRISTTTTSAFDGGDHGE